MTQTADWEDYEPSEKKRIRKDLLSREKKLEDLLPLIDEFEAARKKLVSKLRSIEDADFDELTYFVIDDLPDLHDDVSPDDVEDWKFSKASYSAHLRALKKLIQETAK